MDRNQKNQLTEQWLDAAAGEALGANSPAESAQYRQDLAGAGPAELRTDRELGETVAMLSAASPYMQPPEDLRGRLLEASAPAAFRMEDYRKANRDSGRFYRWAFYAAMLFLAAGAYFNMRLQSSLTASHNQSQALAQQLNDRNLALANLVSPNVDPISLTNHGKTIGKVYVNEKSDTAVVVLPEGLMPQDKTAQFSLNRNGKKTVYHTIVVNAPRAAFPDAGNTLNTPFAADHVVPDTSKPLYTATMGQ